MIPCLSQELLPFLSVTYFFLPPFSTNYPSILSHLILPSISWSNSQSCFSKIHIYNTLLGITFSSILCTCPNQCNLFNLIVSIMVSFFNTCIKTYWFSIIKTKWLILLCEIIAVYFTRGIGLSGVWCCVCTCTELIITSLSTKPVTKTLLNRQTAFSENSESISPLQFSFHHFTEQPQNVKLQILSRPHTFWK